MLALGAVFAILDLSYGVPPQERIHGGVPAPPSYAPHMAALLSEWPRLNVICGGSIVSRIHILTAAHCLTPFLVEDQLVPTFYGRVGSNIWHSGGTVVHFQTAYIHPEWNEDIIKNDVGVLLLTKPLELSDSVGVIRLDFGWVGGDEISYVTGWGTTWPKITDISVMLAPTPDELQLLYVRTLSPAQCEAGIHSSQQWAAIAPPLDPRLEICTFHSIKHGVCHGDSGSALVSAGSGLQTGVVSWGMPCAVGAPDFYTRLRGVRHFLLTILYNSTASEYSLHTEKKD